MRLKPATAILGKNLNPDLDNQEQDLSFVTFVPVEPIPEPFTKPAPKRGGRHSRDNSFEFEFSSSTAKPDQEIIFCGRILTTGGISPPPPRPPYSYDNYGNQNHNPERRVNFAAADHGLYNNSTAANTSPSRSLLMGQARSKSFNSRYQQQTASKPKLGPSKSFAYSSRSGGYAKVVTTEGKKAAAVGEGEAVAGGDGRGLGRSRSMRKSVSFSRCFPIASARHDFY